MTDLPDDIDQLKAMLLELHQENEAKDKLLAVKQEELVAKHEELAAKQEEVAELKTQIELLVEQLNLSKSKRFHHKVKKYPKAHLTKRSSKKRRLHPTTKRKKQVVSPFQKSSSVKFINMNSMRPIASVAKSPYINVELKPLKS